MMVDPFSLGLEMSSEQKIEDLEFICYGLCLSQLEQMGKCPKSVHSR